MSYLSALWHHKLLKWAIRGRGEARFGYLPAPWRFKYFELPKMKGCLFCRGIAAEHELDRSNLVLVRGERAIIMLNRFPYSMGALMIAPVAHLGDYREIEDETHSEMNQMVKRGMTILDIAMHPDGFNVGINQGEAAGAGVKDHLHIHLVPRWMGDTNFMATIGDTRVHSEDVEHMYDRLCKIIDNLSTGSNE